jgi:two-component system, chemotaxis family, protein-glutamate methylesterase/glutaminase
MSVPSQRDYPWHPSVERMVTSALEHYDAMQLIGVLMTGMGRDGADAMTRLRAQGGRTIAEAESSAIVWGMPGELVRSGGAEQVRPVEEIAEAIVELVSAHALR